jgi:hypothetical protein
MKLVFAALFIDIMLFGPGVYDAIIMYERNGAHKNINYALARRVLSRPAPASLYPGLILRARSYA